MKYTCYIIQSNSSGRLYIGQTNNIDDRLQRHNKNLNNATKNKGPWKIIFNKNFDSRPEAVMLEHKLKAFKNPAKILDWILRQNTL